MTKINDIATLEKEGEIAVLTLNSPPVNALSGPVREGINNGIKQAIDDADVKAIVLICEGRTFIAGADITEFGKAPSGEPVRCAGNDRTRAEARRRGDPRHGAGRRPRSGADLLTTAWPCRRPNAGCRK